MKHLFSIIPLLLTAAIIGCGDNSSPTTAETGEEVIHLPPGNVACWGSTYPVQVRDNGTFLVRQVISWVSPEYAVMTIFAAEDAPDGPIVSGMSLNRETWHVRPVTLAPGYYELLVQVMSRNIYMSDSQDWEESGPLEPKLVAWTMGSDGTLYDFNGPGEWTVCPNAL